QRRRHEAGDARDGPRGARAAVRQGRRKGQGAFRDPRVRRPGVDRKFSPFVMVRLSILDLAPITKGSDAATALRNTLDLARHAERLGYHRYWLAEHHNMPGIASAATSVVIGHVAAGTR